MASGQVSVGLTLRLQVVTMPGPAESMNGLPCYQYLLLGSCNLLIRFFMETMIIEEMFQLTGSR